MLSAVSNMLVRNVSLGGPMCFMCLMFSLPEPCELLFYCLLDMSSGKCHLISSYFMCCSVNGSVCCVLDSVCERLGETIR